MINTLNNTIHNLYKTEDLSGDFLVKPLKSYNNFFATKMEQNNSCSWKLANIISGIVAYPIFGLLAGLGIAIKSASLGDVARHNCYEKYAIRSLAGSLRNYTGSCSTSCGEFLSGKIPMETHITASINIETETEKFDEIDKVIDRLSNTFRKAQVHRSCYFKQGADKIMTVTVKTVETTG